jgi:hypothetical protein
VFEIEQQEAPAAPEGGVRLREDRGQRGVLDVRRQQLRRDLRQDAGQHLSGGDDAALNQLADRRFE